MQILDFWFSSTKTDFQGKLTHREEYNWKGNWIFFYGQNFSRSDLSFKGCFEALGVFNNQDNFRRNERFCGSCWPS